jgi:hypothetical protein
MLLLTSGEVVVVVVAQTLEDKAVLVKVEGLLNKP